MSEQPGGMRHQREQSDNVAITTRLDYVTSSKSSTLPAISLTVIDFTPDMTRARWPADDIDNQAPKRVTL